MGENVYTMEDDLRTIIRQEQIEAIAVLRRTGALASLPEKLRETARLREENPELPLSQLAALCDPPVTKSCLNHRLKRLTELAKA